MKKISVLDATLRDGGCVIDFDFGESYMKKILSAQEASSVDIIELGYIDSKAGSVSDRTKYINEQVIKDTLLHSKKEDISYVVMADYGKYDFHTLAQRTESDIDGIRLAFHKKDMCEAIEACKVIKSKGYDVYIQPMITLRYSDNELMQLIEMVNYELCDVAGFYIVDSFGEMRGEDLKRLLQIIDKNLLPNITIGFHSHNNLQLSYSNAISFLEFLTERNIIIDSSIMGMGKGAGNLNTELLLEHLNLYYGGKYNIMPLLNVIDKVIKPIYCESYWGYSVEYYLSSVNHCTPSYAGHFYNKHMLSIKQVGELLSMIDENKKHSFDKEYAESLYCKYNEKTTIEDQSSLKELEEALQQKTVLLLAPGKSLNQFCDKIKEFSNHENVVTIGLNNDFENLCDYVMITRKDVYEAMATSEKCLLVTSNVLDKQTRNEKIFDYKRWIKVKNQICDSSSVVILNILEALHISSVFLAGFDGFTMNALDNYFDVAMNIPITPKLVRETNAFYEEFLEEKRKAGMELNFLTPSSYITKWN